MPISLGITTLELLQAKLLEIGAFSEEDTAYLDAAIDLAIEKRKDDLKGIFHDNCNYMATPGGPCNKCGQVLPTLRERLDTLEFRRLHG